VTSFSPSFCRLLEKAKKASLSLAPGCCSAPSNIALIKYWGKESGNHQIPLNSSLSFTLGGFRSHTTVRPEDSSRFFLNGAPAQLPARMQATLDELFRYLGQQTPLRIESVNTFPTACGIASSASGGAALIGALSDALHLSDLFSEGEHTLWLTEGARLLSGSATRSVVSSAFVVWERLPGRQETQTYAIKAHEEFQRLAHGVVMIDPRPKAISSSQGHQGAATSPFFSLRDAAIPFLLENVQKALLGGDWPTLMMCTEHDAFALHAIMQTMQPPVCYLSKMTTIFLAAFITKRHQHRLRALWTIDAGPNIHLLCPQQDVQALKDILQMMACDLRTSITVFFNNASDFIAIGADRVAALPDTPIQHITFTPT
jgi:diphosphomevalonate decarboxylase